MSRPLSEPLPPFTPPFDHLLRLLSTPPILPAFDPLLAAVHFAHQHRLHPLLPSFLQQLARPLLLVQPRLVESRCHLFLLPLHVQRCILTFLSTTCVPRVATHSSLLSLLHLHSLQCHQHLLDVTTGRGPKQRTASAEDQSLLVSEYTLLLLLHRRLFEQLGQPLLAHLRSPSHGAGVDRLLTQLSAHPTWQRSVEGGGAEPMVDDAMAAADAGASPPVSDAPPQPSALRVLMRKLCEREGLPWDDSVQLPAPQPPSPSNAAEDSQWTSAWPPAAGVSEDWTAASASAPSSLLDFDDSVFALAVDADSAPLPEHEAKADSAAEPVAMEEAEHPIETNPTLSPSQVQPSERKTPSPLPTLPAPSPFPLPATVAVQPPEPPTVPATPPAATMQALLSAVLALQFHLADLQGPLSGQLTDAQLRSHPSLLPLIPHIDALHTLSTAAFAAALFPPADDSALTPASLPTKLLYLLVRLLLTPTTHHERACLLLAHCLGHVAHTEAHRDVLLAVSHGLATHPAAVFSALLQPLVAPRAVAALTSAHLDLIRHCVKGSAARVDLTQVLLTRLCESLVSNAAVAPASRQSAVLGPWAVEVLQVLVEAVPGTGEGGGAVVEVLVTGGRGGVYAALDAGMQSKYGRLLKAVLASWPEECRRRKGELVSACQAMTHFTVRRSVERLMAM